MTAIVLGDARVLHPGSLRWLRALGWMVALFVLIIAGASIVGQVGLRIAVALSGGTFTTGKAAPDELKTVVMALAMLAVLGVYALLVRYGENRKVVELAPRAFPLEWGGGLLTGAALMAITIWVMSAAGWATIAHTPVTQIGSALRDTLQSSILEETLFRLVVFRLIWRAFGVWAALAFSALLFGGLHLLNPNATPFAALCIALEAGILLAAFYVLTGRGWASIGVHAGWNFTQGWIFGAAVSGTSGFAGGPMSTKAVAGVPAYLSGGAFGPEASVPGLAICTLAGVGVLWWAWNRNGFAVADEVVEAPGVASI
jgi:membrane protease YdiL (CAAX protease family)